MRPIVRSLLLFAAMILGVVVPIAPSHAIQTTFEVSMFTDPVPSQCLPNDCSLREAILAANAEAGPNTILLPGGTYTLQQGGVDDTGQAGDLDVTDDTTIQTFNGPATVDGSSAVTGDRVFQFIGGSSELDNVSVTGGEASPDPNDNTARGGGIRNDSSLVLVGGTVSNNSAPGTGGLGGGIFNGGGLTLRGVVFEDNKTEFGFGGGLFTTGDTDVHDSVFRRNSSEFGGAISDNAGGSTEIFDSLLSDNVAGLGGGIYAGNGSNFYITDATFDGNIASDVGGAIRVRDGHVSVSSSTLTNNRAGTDGGALAGKDDNLGTSMALSNSIVAGNIDEDGPGSAGPFPDCYDFTGGIFTSNGYNLFGDADGCAITAGPGDQLGTLNAPVDPLLGPLAFNGGPSPDLLTDALLAGSPAIDSGGTAPRLTLAASRIRSVAAVTRAPTRSCSATASW